MFQGQSYLLQVILSYTWDLLLLREIIQTMLLNCYSLDLHNMASFFGGAGAGDCFSRAVSHQLYGEPVAIT